MRTIKNLIGLIIAGGLAFGLSGCSDDNNYVPGPDPNPNSPQVYFDSFKSGLNSGINDVEYSDEYLLISVSRLKTQAALTVPIKVTYSPKGLSFPDQSVTFAAGEETTYFRVGFDKDALEVESPYYFQLEIDHLYTDPYNNSIPGTPNYAGSLKILEPWVFIAETTCKFTGATASFGDFKQKLYKKEVAGLYMFENWCLNNTGEEYGNLVFTVVNNQLHPDTSVGYHGYSGRWYFYVPWATSDSSSWQINGHLPNPGVSGDYMTYFYLYKVGSTSSGFAMDFNEEAKTARLGGYSRYKNSSGGTFILNYTW